MNYRKEQIEMSKWTLPRKKFFVELLLLLSLFVTGSSCSNRNFTSRGGLEFVYVPAGKFAMGSEQGKADNQPVHQVTIREGFYLSKYEITQAQWQALMGNNPSTFKSSDRSPVENVSWDDAQEFISKLNAAGDGYTYRLPTEAEWEYAARAGTSTIYFWGDDPNKACLYANVADQVAKNSHQGTMKNTDIAECQDRYAETSPVGSFQPNAFGLYDMTGNVWEWCEDWKHSSYDGAPTDGSAWLSGESEKYRVVRGGSWDSDVKYTLPVASRLGGTPNSRYAVIGFRLVALRVSNHP
jgi:formylglycine-generating enzyme required for sulfatase activity